MRGLSFSSEGGSQIYKIVDVNKIATPLFREQKCMTPHHRHTLPPKQAKIVLKLVFFEQDKLTFCGHLVTPYILVIKICMTPVLFGTPFRKNWYPLTRNDAASLLFT